MSIQVSEFQHILGKNDAEYIKLLKEALERQKQITSKAIAKIKELSSSSESSNGWIPCTPETMPDIGQEVICQCRAGIIKVLKLDADLDWYQDAEHSYMSGFVLAWMPLPEPYRGEGEEE